MTGRKKGGGAIDAVAGQLRHLLISSLVWRGVPLDDAEDAAQTVLEKVARDPERFAPQLADLDAHRGYFITMALRTYLMELRAERRRRLREGLHHDVVQGQANVTRGQPATASYRDAVLALIDAPQLTPRQRQYLWVVLVEEMSIEEIATATGTSAAAVRGVLRRAVAAVRYLLLVTPGKRV